ncbi:hypothetical protein [Streptomyces tagetis]|uniref:Uncharacterized protein n=1 Tax=Streptomyces tagetis TaxID=2820809 RepID=A0A940XMN8_9ACTN|nr:hypothetical protein [Streptomyces sp. RG38]MBQ0830377.1 hypothetical protein [Streptomyces sp. RG38]
MARAPGSWTGGGLTARDALRPKRLARAVFHPAWIPPSVDASVERLKRVRLIAGTVAALGVYTVFQGGFTFDEVLENMLTASAVLLFLTPLTVGVMLWVWRHGGPVRTLKVPLLNSAKLLLLFVGSIVLTVYLLKSAAGSPLLVLFLGPPALWMAVVVVRGAVHVSGNFFGTAGVHRCLPPLLATVTTWLIALFDLATGDLHGLSLTMGVVFILGAPVTVTSIALVEMGRLRRRHGIRLTRHPAAPRPPGTPSVPPQAPPYAPPRATPYPPSPPGRPPYGPGGPYGTGNPYAPPPRPHHPGNPYAPHPGNPYAPGPGGS